MNETSLLLNSVQESVLTLINRFDNLYYLENQTGIPIETLEEIKNDNKLIKEMQFTLVAELYYLSIKFGCATDYDYKFFRLSNYKELPLNFTITSRYLIVFNDIQSIKKCLSDGVFNEIINRMKIDKTALINGLNQSNLSEGSFLINKDGSIIFLNDLDIVLSTGTKDVETERSYKFIKGLSKKTDSYILNKLLRNKIIKYDFLNDTIEPFIEVLETKEVNTAWRF